MEKRTYTITDINEDLIHYIDRYLKKVIINAKRRYYRYKTKKRNTGLYLLIWIPLKKSWDMKKTVTISGNI